MHLRLRKKWKCKCRSAWGIALKAAQYTSRSLQPFSPSNRTNTIITSAHKEFTIHSPLSFLVPAIIHLNPLEHLIKSLSLRFLFPWYTLAHQPFPTKLNHHNRSRAFSVACPHRYNSRRDWSTAMSYDENKFASLIDDILRNSDLNTISAKRIRKSLSETLGYDVSEHKVFNLSKSAIQLSPSLTCSTDCHQHAD